MTIDQFTKSSAPVTVVVNVANPVAVKLARILLEQGSRLLIVDRLSPAKKKLLGDLLTSNDCLFMDSESTFKNIEKFKKIDYVYYFLSQLTVGSTYPEIYAESMDITKLEHKEFLRESNRIDAYLKLAVSFDASITVVTSAYVSQFLEPIPESNLQIQKYAESLVLEYVERNNANARIVRVGELIGRDGDLASPTYLARLVREVILRNKVNVFGDGMQQNYLIHSEDAVYAILKAAFTPEAKGRTYLAAYTHPFTSLSLAYQLLELTVEEKEVIFNEVLPHYDKIIKLKDMCLAPSAYGLGWEPQITLEQALSETMGTLAKQLGQKWEQVPETSEAPELVAATTEEKKKPVKKIKKADTVGFSGIVYKVYDQLVAQPVLSLIGMLRPKKKKVTPVESEKRTKTIVAIVVLLVVAFLATPYVHFGVTAYKTYALLKQVKRDVAALDSTKFETYAAQLPIYVNGMADDYAALSYLKYVPKIGGWYTSSADLVYGGRLLASSAATSLHAAAPAVKIVKGFASVSPNNPAGTVTHDYYNEMGEMMTQQSAVEQATQDAKLGNARLQRVSETAFPAIAQGSLTKLKTFSSTYATALDQVSRSYDLIPYLLGYKERRSYYLMIQNETELRATGGWFTNYAVMGIENGQVRQLTVNDIYDFDGKISGVTAPKDMQKALSLKTIKTSLSNWDPELPETSARLTALLNQGNLYKANDVLVTTTFQVVRNILNVLGSIQVEGLGEITSANLYDKVGLLHEQFTPGSQSKNQVVSQFMPRLLDAVATASADKKAEIVKVLGDAIQQGSIMIYSDNIDLRSQLLDVYHTYRVIQPVDNPLFAVDWNWGGNKANRFTKRSTDFIINEETKTATMTMVYTNESKSDDYPEGKYVNVQRVYYPQQFTLLRTIGYSTKPVLYKTDKDVPYFLATATIEKQETKPITIDFTIKELPKTLSLYKQSGIETEAVRVIITRATANSTISEKVLQDQGFTQVDTKWVKTYVRKSDVTVRLSE